MGETGNYKMILFIFNSLCYIKKRGSHTIKQILLIINTWIKKLLQNIF